MRKILAALAVATIGIALTLPVAEAQRGMRGGGMHSGGMRGGGFAGGGMRSFAPRPSFSPRGMRPGWAGRPGGGWRHHRPWRGGWYGGWYPGFYTGYYPYYYDDDYYYDDYYPTYRYRTIAPRYYGGLAPRSCRTVKVKRKGKLVRVRRCR